MVDCEHFFDGYKANPVLRARLRARRLSRPAPAGSCSATPMAARCPTRSSASSPRSRTSSPASTSASTRTTTPTTRSPIRWPRRAAGVRQIQGALNGLGERCGNANLVSMIPTLALKSDLAPAIRDRRHARNRCARSPRSRTRFDELLNRAPDRHAPYVGASAFATKAGIHASALAKDPRTYEHVPPESVGNARAILVSDQAGRSNLIAQLARMGTWRAPTTPGFPGCSTRSRTARRRASPMRRRTRRSSCWRAACSATCRISLTSRVSRQRRAQIQRRRRSLYLGLAGGREDPHRRARPSSPRPKATARSTRSIWRCARTSASIRSTSRTLSSSIIACACFRAAPTR